MDIYQEGSLETSKRKKIETEGDSLELINIEGKKKKMKVKGPTFEVK